MHTVTASAAEAGPIVRLDAGDSLGKVGVRPDELPSRQIKAELVAASLVASGVDAVALGPADWQLGAAWVRATVASTKLPVLAANLRCDGAAPYAGSVVVERGGRRVGVVGVTSGAVAGCEVTPGREALEAAIAALGAVDVVVALVPLSRKESEPMVRDLAVDLLLDADPGRLDPAPKALGAAWVVGAGARGQRVGLTSLTWRAGGAGWWAAPIGASAADEVARVERRVEALRRRLAGAQGATLQRLEQQIAASEAELADAKARAAAAETGGEGKHLIATRLVELDDQVADNPTTAALVTTFKAKLGAPAADATVARVGPAGSPWVGASACAGCHAAEHAQWLTTPHARAWQSLVDDGRSGDPDCFSCHATAVRSLGGPTRPEEVGGLRDVQCEACHGPAHDHLADPSAIRPTASPPEGVCRTCHDGDRDGGRFDPATYLPAVHHRPPATTPPG
jgi:hypothetical protein